VQDVLSEARIHLGKLRPHPSGKAGQVSIQHSILTLCKMKTFTSTSHIILAVYLATRNNKCFNNSNNIISLLLERMSIVRTKS
jgi:hypothetical protein